MTSPTKESHIPIKNRRKLEECEPGATREEVLQFIEKVATSPKSCRKRDSQPHST